MIMKKILLVVLVLLGIIIPNDVFALNVKEFENTNHYVVRIRGGEKKYKEIKKIVRDNDIYNAFVYSLDFDNDNEYSNMDESLTSNDTRIILLSYYGYNYTDSYYDHRNIKYYAITQLLLWREIDKNSEYYFVDSDYNIIYDMYNSEIEGINDLVDRHYDKPSFANNYAYVDETGKHELEDSNGVLERWNLSNNNGLSMYKRDNILRLNSGLTFGRSITFKKTGIKYNNEPIVYKIDGKEMFLLPGRFKPMAFSVTYYTEMASINVKIWDSKTQEFNDDLKNISITLLDKDYNELETKVVNDNGEVIFDNLYRGRYYVKQNNSGTNYKSFDELREVGLCNSLMNVWILNEKEAIDLEEKDLEIEVPDTYLEQKDYLTIAYSFMVVIGFCGLGVSSEKNNRN